MLGYKVGDEFSKLRGRKGNGRRGKKTMKRGKGKGTRIMAYLRKKFAYLPIKNINEIKERGGSC